eukprot:Filipodium_phascolosomae@DN5742_c0_g1_i1.p1
MENVDIGGPCLLRSAAKSHNRVCPVSDVTDYEIVKQTMIVNKCCSTSSLRKTLAYRAFMRTTVYDSAISSFIKKQIEETNEKDCWPDELTVGQVFNVSMVPVMKLKYGCNPHQIPAAVCKLDGEGELPFRVCNGSPGYINLMDALNAWQLVCELSKTTGHTAAASFKHVSPAGAGLSYPVLDQLDLDVFEISSLKASDLTPAATAYLRARNADPKSSFGDFAAVSGIVDLATASILKAEVSDGIIAKAFTEDALNVLKAKKNGAYIILEGKDPSNIGSTL